MDKIQEQKSNTTEPEAKDETPPVPSNETSNDPEFQRLRTENNALQELLRMRGAQDELVGLLREAGARSPDLLFAASKDSLQFCDEGKLQNAAALVENLKRSFPDQFGISRPDTSIDGGAGTLSPTKALTAASLSKMTPAEIQKLNWDDVRSVISER